MAREMTSEQQRKVEQAVQKAYRDGYRAAVESTVVVLKAMKGGSLGPLGIGDYRAMVKGSVNVNLPTNVPQAIDNVISDVEERAYRRGVHHAIVMLQESLQDLPQKSWRRLVAIALTTAERMRYSKHDIPCYTWELFGRVGEVLKGKNPVDKCRREMSGVS